MIAWRSMAAVLAAAVLVTTISLAEVETLTLFQKTGRAKLVVRARALSDSTRRPELLVLETIKGSYPERERLKIVPHAEDNTRPTPWLKREVFKKGEESVLFLESYEDDFGRPGPADTFSVLGAHQGKIDIPPEGADALLTAVRRFAGVLALGQMDAQAAELRAMLKEKNPYLLEAALAECRRFRMAEPADAVNLREIMGHQRPDLRASALALLAQILIVEQTPDTDVPRAALFETVAARARLDEDAVVRGQAVLALEAFGDAAALSVLELVGADDSSQDVRYQALVAARRLKSRLR